MKTDTQRVLALYWVSVFIYIGRGTRPRRSEAESRFVSCFLGRKGRTWDRSRHETEKERSGIEVRLVLSKKVKNIVQYKNEHNKNNI